jgi:hypothetical protein
MILTLLLEIAKIVLIVIIWHIVSELFDKDKKG